MIHTSTFAVPLLLLAVVLSARVASGLAFDPAEFMIPLGFVDREELRQLTQPTLLPNGRRIPGLKLDQPRQLALMHSLVRFCYLAAEGTFTTRELYPQTLQALRMAPEQYKLGSLRYDLWKLRAKGLVQPIVARPSSFAATAAGG